MNDVFMGLFVGLFLYALPFVLLWAREAEVRRKELEMIDRAIDGLKLPSDPPDVLAYLRSKYGVRR